MGYKVYEEELKKIIVQLYENGKKISELEEEYGIGHSNIRNWINKYSSITTSTGETTNNDEILKSSSHILKRTKDKIKFIDEYKQCLYF